MGPRARTLRFVGEVTGVRSGRRQRFATETMKAVRGGTVGPGSKEYDRIDPNALIIAGLAVGVLVASWTALLLLPNRTVQPRLCKRGMGGLSGYAGRRR
jgi:hypothetical protein